MGADVFISYAREDIGAVRVMADDLSRLGWTVWWDDRLRSAVEFDEAIERELDASSCVVVVWSRSSVASGWVRAEASAANDQGKLVPVKFEPEVLPPLRFRQLNTATLPSGRLTPATSEAVRVLVEIARLTGKQPVGIRLPPGEAGGVSTISGARMVTAGRWRLRIRSMRLPGKYELDLYPNGTVSAKLHWVFGDAGGRWIYDAARQVLQLEMSWPSSNGVEVLRMNIIEWIDDNSAICLFEGKKGKIERVGGRIGR